MLKRYRARFPHALRGLRFGVVHDFGFRTQLYGIGAVVIAALYVFSPLTKEEFLFIVLAYVLILITELQNTALEIALNRLHPEQHVGIGTSKDLAAGAVLLAGIFLLVVLAVLIFERSELFLSL